MKSETADIHIHLRAREEQREIIDQAAEASGVNRSQFIMAATVKEAQNVLLDRCMISVDNKSFNEILNWLDNPKTDAERAGVTRLREAKLPWG
jgi:uncharacterized protein (DUF1778 family)